jgi:LPS-assembly protein
LQLVTGYFLDPFRAIRRNLLLLCGFWAAMGLPLAAAEERDDAPWQITADRLTRLQQPGVIIAEGDVVLAGREDGAGRLVVDADWIRYEVEPGVVEARGNVVMHGPDHLVHADEVRLELAPQTGSLTAATIEVPHEDYTLYISGREIEKTGEATYRITEGAITSCPPEPECDARPWVVRSREVRIRQGGMAILRHATLAIKDLPVLYVPYMVFPAKTERESGFLLPEFSNSSRSGPGLITPYFINISPSRDITLYPGYLGKRGPQAGIEGRYVADPRSRGTFLLTYLRDRTVDTPADDFLDDGFLRTIQDRYWLRSKVDHYFSDSLVSRLDVDVVSDRDFIREFRGGQQGFNDTNRQFLDTFNRGLQEETILRRTSSLQVVKSWDTMLMAGELQGVQDLRHRGVIDLEGEPVERIPPTPAQTLPRLGLSGRTPVVGTPLSVVWDSEYVHKWREQGIGYQRLDLFPRLTLPIPRGVLEGRLAAGFRQTSWLVREHGGDEWPHDRTQHRTMGSFQGEVGTTLTRDFELELGAIRTLNHAVRPVINYQYIQEVDQPLAERRIDGVDEIDPREWLTYGVNNHFNVREAASGGGLASRYFGYFRVNQTYDFRENRRALGEQADPADRQRPLSDVLFELDVRPLSGLRLNYETALSVYGQGVPFYKILSAYGDGRHNLFVDYTYQRNPGAVRPFFYNALPTESERKLTLALLSQLSETIVLQGDHTEIWRAEGARRLRDINQSIRLLYQPTCWAVALSFEKTPDDRRIAILFSLTGIGDLLGIALGENNYLRYSLF